MEPKWITGLKPCSYPWDDDTQYFTVKKKKKNNGEGELKNMENQVSTVLMKEMFPIFPLWIRPAVCCVSKRDKAVLDD